MKAKQFDITRVLDEQGGLIARAANTELATSIAWLVRQQRLLPVLPGVYRTTEHADPLAAKIAAVRMWNPDAVLTGAVAAKLTFWPDIPVDTVEVAASSHITAPGFRIERRRLAADLVVEHDGVRHTKAAPTALDLCLSRGPDVIDRMLRSRQAGLSDLHDALAMLKNRRGNAQRRQLLVDSRDEPWSVAERDLHKLLREAGLAGWVANWEVEMLAWCYYVDVAFPDLKLAIEVDGRQFHTSVEAFESDRWRQNDLVLAGWTVLRFTYAMIKDTPGMVIATIRRALGL